MKRDYDTGEADDIIFFTGVEVEKTPAYGMHTLFVTGVQPVETIEKHYNDNNCEHIFFGANHSFKPNETGPKSLFDSWQEWEDMIDLGCPAQWSHTRITRVVASGPPPLRISRFGRTFSIFGWP